MDYINGLGAKTICLSRVISKHSVKKIDELYGNEGSMKELREQLDQRGMHLILDMPLSYLENNDEVKFLEPLNF